LWRGVFLLLN
jgi:uncharacterized membrane protein YeaQ/YmgE (transglycosylase-associated protein family)